MSVLKVFNTIVNLQEHPGDQNVVGRRDSQLLHGEYFDVQSFSDKIEGSTATWAYGRSVLDGYTGWVKDTTLQFPHQHPTHAVTSLMSNAHPAPDFKTIPVKTFSFMSRLTIDPTRNENGFVGLQNSDLWVPESHLLAIGDLAANPVDIVETALMFTGSPYRYGGRAATGIDCSAIVQLALQRNGIECPRDTDQQLSVVGNSIPLRYMKRGDIVYFPGHVGIMVDRKNVFNATARHMTALIEPLSDLKHYYEQDGKSGITDVRRLTP